ncbi:hypothetical protein OKW22_000677 [Bacilli bacterium PM5-3]|nr:hypothetical protein [Bacilli bacterium PM5-3]
MAEKNLTRTFNKDIFIENKQNLNILIKAIKKDKELYMAFRTDKIQIYYHLRLCMTIYMKDNIAIKLRDLSAGNTEFNNDLKNNLPTFYINNKPKSIDLLSLQNLTINDYSDIFNIIKNALDKYYINTKTELMVQQDYVIKYNNLDNLYILDTEYQEPFNNDIDRKASTIRGRYDMIALKKIDEKHYKLIFIELKINKSACIDKKSGIINHIVDMVNYLKQSDLSLHKENIKFHLDMKYEMQFLKEKINNDFIDYKNPEFWILYDNSVSVFVENEYDIKNLICEEIKATAPQKKGLKKYAGENTYFENYDDVIKYIKNTTNPIRFFKGNIIENELSELEVIK